LTKGENIMSIWTDKIVITISKGWITAIYTDINNTEIYILDDKGFALTNGIQAEPLANIKNASLRKKVGLD
jgi:hypothetical protein